MFFIMHGENGKFIHSSNADVYFFAPRSKLGSKIKIWERESDESISSLLLM